MSEEAPPCRVVVCDDQEGFRRLVTLVLGLDPALEVVGEAGNGSRAVELARTLRPDVLVLDVAMPVLDGLEALPMIRAASPETQVVMLTGVTAESVRRRALEGGACMFVEKGIDVDALADCVKDACRSPSGAR